jgi:uncharacterized protein (DUF2235 family)
MAKNIIFCADGTWNGPGEPDSDDKTAPPTNVFKLFLNLRGKSDPGTTKLEKEQELSLKGNDGTLQQVAKYLHGVGDSDNFLVKVLGGKLGAGLIMRIVRGYTFISRNYQPGDKIFIVGFSRGAYTARAVAALISSKGLLDANKLDLTDKETAYRLGVAVWFANRKAALVGNQGLLSTLFDFPLFLMHPPSDDDLVLAPIEAVGVWETVGALGVPLYVYNETLARADLFCFADTKLSANVRQGRHAVAVDEERTDFTPTLWEERDGVVQVLFPGAHADVGGGYKDGEIGLSDGALKWMMDELESLGVQFSSDLAIVPKPDFKGVAHQPWRDFPFNILLQGPRVFPKGLCLSRSVLARIGVGPVISQPDPAAPYAPRNLSHYVLGDKPSDATIKLV